MFVFAVGCLFIILLALRVDLRAFNSDNFFACDLDHERFRLNQTDHTCKLEHVSCRAAY